MIPWFLISLIQKFILVGKGKRVKRWVVRTQTFWVPGCYLGLSLLTIEIYILLGWFPRSDPLSNNFYVNSEPSSERASYKRPKFYKEVLIWDYINC